MSDNVQQRCETDIHTYGMGKIFTSLMLHKAELSDVHLRWLHCVIRLRCAICYQSSVDILNNVRREVSRHFRDKKKAYLRAKIEELETNSKIQNIRDLYRGISDFK